MSGPDVSGRESPKYKHLLSVIAIVALMLNTGLAILADCGVYFVFEPSADISESAHLVIGIVILASLAGWILIIPFSLASVFLDRSVLSVCLVLMPIICLVVQLASMFLIFFLSLGKIVS